MPTSLEDQFRIAMVSIYQRATSEADYNAARFLQMVLEQGAVQAAKSLINAPKEPDGYTELYLRGRLDLTVEALVVENSKWHPLFEPGEIQKARARLKAYGRP